MMYFSIRFHEFVFILFLFQLNFLNAQNKNEDLFEVDLNNAGETGKLLVKTQQNLGKNLDSAYYYANTALKKSIENKNKSLTAHAYYFLGIHALFSKNYEDTNKYMQQCFDIAKEQNFQTFKLETNRIFAVTASYTNNKDLALQYFLEALKYAKNSSEDISIRNDIAVLYIQANKNDLARTLLLEGLSTMEDENSEDQFLLHTYTNLCIVSASLKEGILYIDKALKIAQKLGYQEKELEVLIAKASHYKKHKKYHLAIPILENVVTQARLLNQKNYEYKATLLLVKCLSETGKYYQAKDYIKPVIELTKSLQDKESLYELDSIAFKVYTKTNSFKEAVFYADNYISHLYNTRNANRDSLFIEYAKKYETDLKIKENEILKRIIKLKG